MSKFIEKDVSFADFCVSCGHYHQEYTKNRVTAYHCVLSRVGDDCKCINFVGRSFKRSFS